MSNTPQNLIKWIKERPLWLQEAAKRLHINGSFSLPDENDFAELCKKESQTTAKETLPCIIITEDVFRFSGTSSSIKLKSISEPKGIDELNPKKPLKFNDDPLSIIYGENGSGKSGYIRILKKICGARASRDLIGNAFDSSPQAQSCKISFSLDGVDKEIVWDPKHGSHNDLRSIEIYDADGGRLYTNQANEVLYEPPILAFFQHLIDITGKVDGIILSEIKTLVSKKPELPDEYLRTRAAKWYSDISSAIKDSNIDIGCQWSKANQETLDDLNKRIAEANPADEAKKIRKRKDSIIKLADYLDGLHTKLNDEVIKKTADARQIAFNKRKAASEDAQKVFAQPILSGIGEESWKLLWEKAKDYSTKVAYPDKSFPNVELGAKCVLCQQELSKDAKSRLTSFENFVMGSLETEAKNAEDAVNVLIKALPISDSPESFSSRLAASLIIDTDFINLLTTHHNELSSRLEAIKNNTVVSDLPNTEVITKLKDLAASLELQAERYDEDAKKAGRATLQAEAKELSAQKWVSEQKNAISEERNRLVLIQQLEAARKLLNTKALSDKKTQLTTEIITEAFIKRFEDELKSLSASRIKAEIVKTKTTKGQVWHQIKLKGAHSAAKTDDVLSEGEQRVVSIAAFLAESEGIGANTPLIFDDPISSLDQQFEEATVKRLVSLSKKRQVIVFTHRISLAVLLEDAAELDEIKPTLTTIQRESWGTGEPSDPPPFSIRPKEFINSLLGRVPQIKKIYNDEGSAIYAPEAERISKDIRITLERLIEYTLLDKIVLRYRREITTKQIRNLAKIKSEDCKLIYDLMTEYSKYMHSQSAETPIAPPTPDQIEADLKRLKDWCEEFNKRPIE